jgi:aspartate 1-decarboxylase
MSPGLTIILTYFHFHDRKAENHKKCIIVFNQQILMAETKH